MSTGDRYGHRQGRKRRVLRSSSPCDQDCWYIDLVGLKALALKLSRPSGQPGSYTDLIGFNPRWLKGPKRGMSSHATDLSVYAKSSSSSSHSNWSINLQSFLLPRTFTSLSPTLNLKDYKLLSQSPNILYMVLSLHSIQIFAEDKDTDSIHIMNERRYDFSN